MEVQHPRGTDVDGRRPPSQVTIPGHGNVAVDDDGYLADLEADAARRAMQVLGDAYGVTYTDDGDVVREEDGPPDADKTDPAPDEDDADKTDPAPDEDDADADICGFEKDDGSICQRSAGWGRDADSGRCKDHHEDEEA